MMKKDLTTRFNLIDKKIVVHYPELNDEKFLNSSGDIREEHGIYKDTIVIGLITSGNFKKRNVQLLLESMAEYKTDKKIHILIAGKDKSEPFKELIDKSIHPISFLAPCDDVEKYYNSVDIFTLPAHIEEFGMSVLEAMACEKPVLVGMMVGASEILEGESCEYILSDLAVETFQEKMHLLIEDSELRSRLGKLNRETAIKFSSKEQGNKFCELLSEIGF
jgi:UDP-glucose:(heptosyl)LPS alpha-1,3-glucosyltransferase